MKSMDEIRKIKERYKDLYQGVRTEQRTDLEYINDTFAVPEIHDLHKIVRSGLGREIVDAPAEQIVTSSPLAFINALKESEAATKATAHLSKILNQDWIPYLKGQNPNPFKQSVKNKLGRGENYIKIMHNRTWVTKGETKIGSPILFFVPDPMVIYGSLKEDDCGWLPNAGVPNEVVVFYERQPLDVILIDPNWKRPADKKDNEPVEWFEYWNKDTRCFEADGVPVLGGIQPNIYGFTPWVRKFSGFGTTSPEGKLEELILSDIRFVRGLLKEECLVNSNISSILTLFAHRPRLITSPGEINEKDIIAKDYGAYSVTVHQNVPPGTEFKWEEVPQPSAEMFNYHASVMARIQQRNPFILSGFPMGSSGRQQIDSYTSAMKRYDTIIENTDLAWATAFEMAFKVMDKIPAFPLPEGLNKSDLAVPFKCEVKLQAPNLQAESMQKTIGDRLWARGQGSISLSRFHTQYQGMTQNESDREIARMMVDSVTLYDEEMRAVMAMAAAKELGMEGWLEEIRARQAQQQTQQTALRKQPPASTMERVQGQFSEPLGEGEMDALFAGREDVNRGARMPPP